MASKVPDAHPQRPRLDEPHPTLLPMPSAHFPSRQGNTRRRSRGRIRERHHELRRPPGRLPGWRKSIPSPTSASILLHLDGHSTRDRMLVDRKALLADLLDGSDANLIRISEHIETSGQQMFQNACELHAEGIISKRTQSTYISGRSGDWLKLKCLHEQEFVIGGFTSALKWNPRHRRATCSATISTANSSTPAAPAPASIRRPTSPFATSSTNLPPTHPPSLTCRQPPARERHWLKSTLVAQVRFATWTAENQLRQAAFLGLRGRQARQRSRPRRSRALRRNAHAQQPDKARTP